MSFQPPPTWALPVAVDETTGKASFNPIWLKWFVDLASVLNKSGVSSTGTLAHNSLGGLQGGLATERYHLNFAEYTRVTGTVIGTVTDVSVAAANGFAGTVATSTTTPVITLTTSITGLLKGNGTAISASVVTDDVQTKAAIVPNTAPAAGGLLVGNAGATAYAPVAASGAVTLASTGTFSLATPGTLTVSTTNTGGTGAHVHTITSSNNPGAAASILATDASGHIGVTANRIVKGWFVDLTVTNAIAASITGSAATLTTPRSIYGNNFDGSAALGQIIASTFGGTGNGFTKFSGPAAAEKTFTLPNASAVVLTDNAAVTVAQGGTGVQTLTTAYGLLAAGTTATGNVQTIATGATTAILVGGGASALPVWTTAQGSGAPVRATSPTLTTPNIGAATGTSVTLDSAGVNLSGSFTSSGSTGTVVITDTGANGANLKFVGNGATTPNKYVRVTSGVFQIGNSGYTQIIMALTDAGNLSAVGSILSSNATGGIGYATGAGGAVTQATSKATGVTLNTACGAITMNNASLAANTRVQFVFTNSAIAAGDTVIIHRVSGGTGNAYLVNIDSTSAGSCVVTVWNYAGGALAEAIVLGFAVVKVVTS